MFYRISPDFIQALRDRIQLSELIGHTVPLRHRIQGALPARPFLKDTMAGKQNAAIHHRDAGASRSGSETCNSSTSRRAASASISTL